MRFFASASCILALVIASPFFLGPTAAASRLKGRGRSARRLSAQKKAEDNERRAVSSKPNKRRKLNGKGGKGGGPDDDFYRFPCEFCGEGNDSALGGSITCFSKYMTVKVLGRGLVAMEHLKVGDKVLTEDGAYQSVYSFGHFSPDEEATFLQIHSGSGKPLEITHDHLVYLADKHNPIRAGSVKVGDVLMSATDDKTTVRKIETVQKSGIYAPLTLSGSLVVNDILASSYISIQDRTEENTSQSTISSEYMVIQGGTKLQIPIISHRQYVDVAISPYRLACRIAGNSLCDTTKGTSGGIPLYVKIGLAFHKLANPNLKVHPLVLLTTMLLSSPFWALERALFLRDGGLNWAVVAVVFSVAAIYISLKQNRVSFVGRKVKTA